jgi:hypothetical protein
MSWGLLLKHCFFQSPPQMWVHHWFCFGFIQTELE